MGETEVIYADFKGKRLVSYEFVEHDPHEVRKDEIVDTLWHESIARRSGNERYANKIRKRIDKEMRDFSAQEISDLHARVRELEDAEQLGRNTLTLVTNNGGL